MRRASPVAQSAARLIANRELESQPGHIIFMEMIKMTHEIISTTILLTPLIQAEQLLCVHSALVNRLEGLRLPSNMNMSRSTTKQTN